MEQAESLIQNASNTAKGKFGKTVSPHMLLATYQKGSWGKSKIIPFQNLSLSPTAMALHYGQTIFEGMKAFKRVDGKISLFRLAKHYERFRKSADRMCMPAIPEEQFYDGLKSIVKKDASWVPGEENAALYIRPFMFASEEQFGVKISEEYQFVIFTGPVGNYFDKPLHVKVEDHYIRAAKGGIGYAKCGGNYGGAYYPTDLAKKEGFDQVIWTDGSADLYMEESGTMNLFFMIDDVLITPNLTDTILDGITRDSLIVIAKEWCIRVEERRISAHELIEANEKGTLQEAFGCGTAAVAMPMASVTVKGQRIELPSQSEESFCSRAKQYLQDVRRGISADKYSWNTIV